MSTFNFDILEKNNIQEIVKIGEKNIYNTDDTKSLQFWIKQKVDTKKTKEFLIYKSSLFFSGKSKKFSENSIAFLGGKGNSIMTNGTHYSLMSVPCSLNYSPKEVTKENFKDMITYFTVRKIIKSDWINQKDEYLAPKEENINYLQFVNDGLVFSLFNNSSYQTSLRQITYKDKLWDIKNEFFWMSKEEMLNLANDNNYTELYSDARTDSDRHVHKLLFSEERIYDRLSPDAKLVLDKATDLVRKSMPMREMFANDENHLKSWDAGYAQLKLLWKEYYTEDFKEFRELYKKLEDRMRPLVYELGFLMK